MKKETCAFSLELYEIEPFDLRSAINAYSCPKLIEMNFKSQLKYTFSTWCRRTYSQTAPKTRQNVVCKIERTDLLIILSPPAPSHYVSHHILDATQAIQHWFFLHVLNNIETRKKECKHLTTSRSIFTIESRFALDIVLSVFVFRDWATDKHLKLLAFDPAKKNGNWHSETSTKNIYYFLLHVSRMSHNKMQTPSTQIYTTLTQWMLSYY